VISRPQISLKHHASHHKAKVRLSDSPATLWPTAFHPSAAHTTPSLPATAFPPVSNWKPQQHSKHPSCWIHTLIFSDLLTVFPTPYSRSGCGSREGSAAQAQVWLSEGWGAGTHGGEPKPCIRMKPTASPVAPEELQEEMWVQTGSDPCYS
jgi:hypothetical protein